MVLTGGRVVNTATNLVTSHNLETEEEAVPKLEKKSEWGKNYIELWNLSECQSLCLLASTGALIVMMCFYISATAGAATFLHFHSAH